MKRVVALLMAALMICAMFAGCDDKKEEKETDAITMDVYKGGLLYVDAIMQQNYGIALSQLLDTEMITDTTGADFIKQNADDMFSEFSAVRAIAKEKGIKITDEEKKQAEEGKDQIIEAGITNEAFYYYITYSQMLFGKIGSELFMGDGEYAMSAEEMVAYAEEKQYVRVKHVLVQTTEDAEDFEEKKALASEIAAKAKAGEDFEALIAEYGEDPGMESYAHGYIIDQNGYTTSGSAMVQEFTAGSTALEVGGVSEPVKTDYGFHIIKRYPIDVASINEKYDIFASEFAQPGISELILEYKEKTKPEYPEGYEDVDLYELFGVEKKEEAPEAEGETGAEGGIEVGTAESADQ